MKTNDGNLNEITKDEVKEYNDYINEASLEDLRLMKDCVIKIARTGEKHISTEDKRILTLHWYSILKNIIEKHCTHINLYKSHVEKHYIDGTDYELQEFKCICCGKVFNDKNLGYDKKNNLDPYVSFENGLIQAKINEEDYNIIEDTDISYDECSKLYFGEAFRSVCKGRYNEVLIAEEVLGQIIEQDQKVLIKSRKIN